MIVNDFAVKGINIIFSLNVYSYITQVDNLRLHYKTSYDDFRKKITGKNAL